MNSTCKRASDVEHERTWLLGMKREGFVLRLLRFLREKGGRNVRREIRM